MAIRVQNFPKKNFDQNPIHSMSHFAANCPSWWNSHEQQFSESLSKNLSLKVKSPPQLCKEAKHLGRQLQDRKLSSTQSTSRSHHEVTAMGGTNSQDQCISSKSVQDESYGKGVEGQMKPVFFMGNPDLVISPSQVDISQTMNRITYPYADPYFSGLFTAYGPQAIIQPQMVGVTPARVPLPLDLAEDGPIYVNAKQYHGILRRRQTRAKLEAQNKLVKTRRPYLHKSRHLHALNRVRGSGGRFLGTKKLQHPEQTPTSSSHCPSNSERKGDMFEIHQSETGTSITNSDVLFQHQDRRFSGISPHMGFPVQGTGGLMRNGTQHRAPVVR
uniref:Nuclear transcription factor Y subunit n=1 Tax=Davidia involucrata TaxID=16924 RepID=A0A5B6ZLS0_DAVIN